MAVSTHIRCFLALAFACASFNSVFAQSDTSKSDVKTEVKVETKVDTKVDDKLSALTAIDCPKFDELISYYQKKFQSKMLDWSDKNLSSANYQTAFYPFSGPDVVTVMSLYPKANYYVMVADQVPEYESIDSSEKLSKKSQQFECQMLTNFSRRGYYRTHDLNGKDGPKPRFIKLLIYNIAFAGSKIKSVETLTVNGDGLILVKKSNEPARGVRFQLETKDNRNVTLDYLSADLSNGGFEKLPQFTTAFSRKGSQVVLLKSASHLLQNPRFSSMADILLKNAKWVVQDETGLDITPLSNTFDLDLYGKFVAAHPLWSKSESASRLAKYFSSHTSKEDLPFYLGYEKQGGSILMVGKRKQ
jgi:hypothetical protein